MYAYNKLIEDTKRGLKALDHLRDLKKAFYRHDGKMFNKRVAEGLPEGVYIQLHEGQEVRVDIYIKRRHALACYLPLEEKKRINAAAIDAAIDEVANNRIEKAGEILSADLEGMLKAAEALQEAEKALQAYNYSVRMALTLAPHTNIAWGIDKGNQGVAYGYTRDCTIFKPGAAGPGVNIDYSYFVRGI